jgi:hypothetical protein
MIRKQHNLLDAKIKKCSSKIFRRDKKVGTVIFLYSKILSCKIDAQNDNLTHFSPNSVIGCISNVERGVGGNL